MCCAIAASLAAKGLAAIGLFDTHGACAEGLADCLRRFYPALQSRTGFNDTVGYALVVNATPSA